MWLRILGYIMSEFALKRQKDTSAYWAGASVLTGGVFFLLFVAAVESRSAVLAWISLASITCSIVMAVFAIVKAFRLWLEKRFLVVLQLAVLFVAAFLILSFTAAYISKYKSRNTVSRAGLNRIREAGSYISEYMKQSGNMPTADMWYFELRDSDITARDCIKIPQLRNVECVFAYNENLSNLPTDELDGNVVVLFETDGHLNQTGGPELIDKPRIKDEFFLFKKQRFIYVLFTDGTIVKYRLRDGAVAIYDQKKDEFGPYFEKGQTPYSPLRWEN